MKELLKKVSKMNAKEMATHIADEHLWEITELQYSQGEGTGWGVDIALEENGALSIYTIQNNNTQMGHQDEFWLLANIKCADIDANANIDSDFPIEASSEEKITHIKENWDWYMEDFHDELLSQLECQIEDEIQEAKRIVNNNK